MKKDLVIIGAYPNTSISIDVLKECILKLKNTFDVALSTHYPVNEEIQNLVDYYIYDSHNDLIDGNDNPSVWLKNDIFYLQVKQLKNYAYSVYSCILNSAQLLHKKYDYFYYINSDVLIDEKDLSKLINLKELTLKNNKKSLFFKRFEGMVDCVLFFSETKFFIDNFCNVKSKEEFIEYTKNFTEPYVIYVLESFYCERINNWLKNETYIVHENLEDYLPHSQIDVLKSFNGKSEKKKDYEIQIVKEKDSERIFFVYYNNNANYEKKEINVKIDDNQFILKNGNYSFYTDIFTDKEYINVEVENVVNTYKVKDILTNYDTYIKFN